MLSKYILYLSDPHSYKGLSISFVISHHTPESKSFSRETTVHSYKTCIKTEFYSPLLFLSVSASYFIFCVCFHHRKHCIMTLPWGIKYQQSCDADHIPAVNMRWNAIIYLFSNLDFLKSNSSTPRDFIFVWSFSKIPLKKLHEEEDYILHECGVGVCMGYLSDNINKFYSIIYCLG